jgi:hypothetical protein
MILTIVSYDYSINFKLVLKLGHFFIIAMLYMGYLRVLLHGSFGPEILALVVAKNLLRH